LPAGWSASRTELGGAQPFLIAAASGRALAASAKRAGYRVSVLDLFGDSDLVSLATRFARVARGETGGFDSQAVADAAGRLAPGNSNPLIGFVYGSGFEDRPDLLARMARGRELFGNAPLTLARAKDPMGLAGILAELELPHPETRLDPPPRAELDRWLVKRAGGAGGVHIRRAGDAGGIRGGCYYQRFVAGRSVSALVLGAATDAVILGLSEQWTEPSRRQPFRFGGVAAPAEIPGAVAAPLVAAARALARRLGLIGLNSVDFILDGENFWVIEVNPRPGASLDVFERLCAAPLFELHLRACRGDLPRETAPAPRHAEASAVFYGDSKTAIAPGFDWPEWTADRPASSTRVRAGEPLCTVFADGERPGVARKALRNRCETLRAALARCMQASARKETANSPRAEGDRRQEGIEPREKTKRPDRRTA
jgi:predicted ATP-grasp superfamily ATP-dependent carboligase